MAKNLKRHKNPNGFTLIELAIMLLVFSFIAASALTTRDESSGLGNQYKTQQKLQRIKTALAAYNTENSKIPCPADPSLAITNAAFGTADGADGNCGSSPGDCTDGVCESADGFVSIGMVPVRTLGLNVDDAFDAWGNRITYAVTQAQTTATSSAGTVTVLHGMGDTAQADSHVGSNNNATYQITTTASYVLVSHGNDGIGAYINSGSTTRVAGTAGGYQAANIPTSGDSYNHIFLKLGAPPASASAAKYDDLVEWDTLTSAVTDTCNSGTLPTPSGQTLLMRIDACDLANTQTKFYTGETCSGATEITDDASITDGTLVGCISYDRDSSGTPDVYLRATGSGVKPSVQTNVLNGKPVIEFDGTRVLKTYSTTSGSSAPWAGGDGTGQQPNTIFIVAKRDNVGSTAPKWFLMDGFSGTNRHALYLSSSAMRINSGTLTAGSAVDRTTFPNIHTVQFNDNPNSGTNLSKFWYNGIRISSIDGNSNADSMTGLTFGADHSNATSTSQGLDGYIAEILVYTRNAGGTSANAMSDADREAIEAYLIKKWFLPNEASAGATPTLWLDAAANASTLFTGGGCTGAVAGGSSVSCVKDRMGESTFSATAGTAPTYTAAAAGTGPYITFNGTSSFLTNSAYDYPNATTATIAAIANAKYTASTSGHKPILFNDYNFYLGDFRAGTSGSSYPASGYGNDSAWTGAGRSGWIHVSGAHTVGSINLYVTKNDGTNDYFWFQGTSLGSRLSAMTAIQSGDEGFMLGRDSTSSLFFEGDMQEVIMYEDALDDTARQRLQCYLYNKWSGPGTTMGTGFSTATCDTLSDP